MVWYGKGTVYKEQFACHRKWCAKVKNSMENIFSREFLDYNLHNILNFASLNKFPKICDYCENIFEADIGFLAGFGNKNNRINCPICGSLYYAVRNELNNFYYLEFVKEPEPVLDME